MWDPKKIDTLSLKEISRQIDSLLVQNNRNTFFGSAFQLKLYQADIGI